MKTNQSFIGAYTRNRRLAGDETKGEATRQTVPPPHLPPATNESVIGEPADRPIVEPIDQPVDPANVIDSVEELINQSLSVSDVVADSVHVWVEQPQGQLLRFDPPSAPVVDERAVDEPAEVESHAEAAQMEESVTESIPAAESISQEAVSEEAVSQETLNEETIEADSASFEADLPLADALAAAIADVAPIKQEPIEMETALPEPPISQPLGIADTPAEAESADDSTQDSPASLWQGAAWEVDSFEIPRRVAELFFDEEFFRVIAEHLGQSVKDGLRSVLVTSLMRGEGRSTVALGTAIAAAATGIRVALVDVDVDRPGQAEQLRMDVDADWIEMIRSGQPLENAAVVSIEDGVTLLPLLSHTDNPITPLELDCLTDRLTGCFDLVMFDSSSVDDWATQRIASSIDSALIVRDVRSTSTAEIALAANRLRHLGLRGIGVVDNFSG